jgi:2-polyprenyl-3-methyl-5-hydroxy-6-metoxy-1,4-benzoquinol methylase
MNSNLEQTFTGIFNTRAWHSNESISGNGSELKQTQRLINELPALFKKYDIKSILDIPCGDYNWMQHVDRTNIDYIGADIVEPLIEANKQKYPNINFQHLDLTNSELPQVDLILARDVFVHMTYETIIAALENIIKSRCKYLLTTSFTGMNSNWNLTTNGDWRPLNLLIEPFRFKPIYLINEDCTEGDNNQHNDKCLILFEVSRLYIGS